MDEGLYKKLTEAGVLKNDHNLESFGPVHAHDCEACLFLGQYGEADLYLCPKEAGGPTVIARFSGEPSDYASGMPIAESKTFPTATIRPLRVAWLIARDCGLVEDPKPAETGEEMNKRLLWEAVEKRYEPEDLDEYVHDAVSQDGSAINNAGLEAQFDFLYAQLGPDWIERELLKE
jgi:hypothetical protein